MKKTLFLLVIICLSILSFALCVSAENTVDEALMSEIFVFKGYSTTESGGKLAIGFGIDYDAITEYESTHSVTLSYGVVFANYDTLKGQAPLDSKGNPIDDEGAKVARADLTEYDSPIFDFIIANITDEYKNLSLVISAYISDGSTTKYVQGEGLTDNVSGISYNEAASINKPEILTDDNGFTYELQGNELTVIGFDKAIDSSVSNGIYVPMECEGYTVTGIGENAFTEYGEKFTASSYANIDFGFVILYLPTTITTFGDNAFEGFYSIDVALYDGTGANVDYRQWDKGVTWGSGNLHARDCIWNFRPALGWTRYSNVIIPEDY